MENKHLEYQYLDLLKQILEKGDRKVDRGTGDASFSLFGAQMRFDLSQGFPLLTTKKVFWKGVVEELYWFASGQSNVAYLAKKGVHIWDDYPYKIYNKKNPGKMTKEEFVQKIVDDDQFAKENGELPKIYGELWRRWPTRSGRTIDQLAWAIQELKDDPNAHNLIVNSWNSEYLYSMAVNEDASRFPICHNMYQFDLINGKLNLQLYQRSADMFLGVPFNIASYALLTVILARVTGYEPGEFIHTLGDFHIYEKHIDAVKEQLTRTPNAFPKVELDASIKNIDDFIPEKVKLIDYNPQGMIKAELSVSGGLYEKQ
ncbi:MAG: thymidylate synthase [Candidatus Doudnabacteria bacterium]|nr:thymidylate synthase [Candidatus Doudnabacteria bacterium]